MISFLKYSLLNENCQEIWHFTFSWFWMFIQDNCLQCKLQIMFKEHFFFGFYSKLWAVTIPGLELHILLFPALKREKWELSCLKVFMTPSRPPYKPFSHWPNVSSLSLLYHDLHGKCSHELHSLVSPVQIFIAKTCHAMHTEANYPLNIPLIRRKFHLDSFSIHETDFQEDAFLNTAILISSKVKY